MREIIDCKVSFTVSLIKYVPFVAAVNMPILFSVVARGPIILAKHAACTGNFEEVTEKILAKIPPHNDKLTYSQGPYLFHYICEDYLIYMCITDDVCI